MWLRRLARARREVVSDMRLDTDPDDEKSALDSVVENEEAGLIAAALNKLGDPCRTLLLLYYWEELSTR